MSEEVQRVEVITAVQRRRLWSVAAKIRLVEETLEPGMSVSFMAHKHGISPSLLFNWRRSGAWRAPRALPRGPAGARAGRAGARRDAPLPRALERGRLPAAGAVPRPWSLSSGGPGAGRWDSRCFLPIHIYEAPTGKPVALILRPGKTPRGAEVALALRQVGQARRARWPRVDLLVRGDSHYGRPEAMTWGEQNRGGYIFGRAGNPVLATRSCGPRSLPSLRMPP